MPSVLITGASRGIGLAISRYFFFQGYEVYGTCSSQASITQPDLYSQFFCCNFSSIAEIKSCAQWASERKPNVLINNAGINKISPFLDISFEDFSNIQSVNLYAPFLITQSVLPPMIDANYGRILNISSIWGIIGKEYRASYSISKFGLDGLTVSLSAEFASSNILVNCLSPGFTNTKLTQSVLGTDGIAALTKTVPLGRLAEPDEIAKFAFWLSSPENTYITGQNFAIDGGFTRV